MDQQRHVIYGMTPLMMIGALLLSIAAPLSVMARPQYVNRVPTRYSCDTCHLSAVNRNLRTGFGIDFGLSRGVWADEDPEAGICRLDSDGDDLTNGQELGDPDCVWRVGDRLPVGPTTNPADARDPDRCGDGVLQEGERCDGDQLNGATCAGEGFMDGEIACNGACDLDLSGCNPFLEPDMAVPLDMGAPDVTVPDEVDADRSDDDQPEIDMGSIGLETDAGSDAQLGDAAMIDTGESQSVGDAALDEDMAISGGNRSGESGGCSSGGRSSAHLLWGLLLCGLLRRRRGR
jgi:hypothetical protein